MSSIQTVTLIPGDGIGPEVTAAAVRVLEAAGGRLEWEPHAVGLEAIARHEEALPQRVVDSIRRHKVCLKGPVTTPVGKGFRSINVQLRQALELYANLRPAKSLPGLGGRFEGVDLVIVRENTEGLYSGLEHQVVPGVVESLKIITEKASTRIARFAFEHARKTGRKRITVVHKANIMKLSDGLFLECCRKVATSYPDVRCDDRIIDALCMQLVMRPEAYDMLLLENLYGDIVSDLAAGLVGGLGLVEGANLGEDAALFEAVHGSAPDIAGLGVANPTAVIRAGIALLRHVGQDEAAARAEAAVTRVLVDKGIRTRDLGGQAGTAEFTEAIVREIGEAA